MNEIAASATNPDVQPVGQHLNTSTSCVAAATGVAKEYAARVRFYGLVAGVGDPKDVEAARETIRKALEGIDLSTSLSKATAKEEETRRAHEQARTRLNEALYRYRSELAGPMDTLDRPLSERELSDWIAARPDLPAELRELAQAERQAYGAFTWAYDNRTVQMHGALRGVFRWFGEAYNAIVASIRDGTWKAGLCRFGAEVGFAILEGAAIAALGTIGLGAALAVLKISAKAVNAGSSLVRISVRATRSPRPGRLLDPERESFELDFHRPIDTDRELTPDERRLLGEENQGNTRPTGDAGPVDGDGHAAHRGARHLDPKMRQKLEDEQSQMMETTRATLGNKTRGPVLTSVVDPKTGQVFHGINGGIPPAARTPGDLPTDLDPVLKERVDRYWQSVEAGTSNRRYRADGTAIDGAPGHHSEIWALNQALSARRSAGMPVDETTLEELFLSNKRLTGSSAGKSIVRCPDCSAITKGANDISGDIPDIAWRRN